MSGSPKLSSGKPTSSGLKSNRFKENVSNPRRGEERGIGTVASRLDQVSMEPAFLCSTDAALNSKQAGRIARQAKATKKAAVVFATHRVDGAERLNPNGHNLCPTSLLA